MDEQESLWYEDIFVVVVGNQYKAWDSSHSFHHLCANRSVPGTPGLLKEVTVKCPSMELGVPELV